MNSILEKIFTIKRPWGKFEQFTHNEQTTVKILTIEKGQRISKQRHKNREELWIALDDGLIAEIDEKLTELKKGNKILVPKGSIHRITAKETARFLEISYGEFDELDIERLSDEYGRVSKF